MKSILLVFIILFPFAVFAEKLRVYYNYESYGSVTRSGTDFLFGHEIKAYGNEIIISSMDGAIVKSKTIIPKAPYQFSYHVEIRDSDNTGTVKMYDKKNEIEISSPAPSVVIDPNRGLNALNFWNGPQYAIGSKLPSHFFCNAPNIVNAVNSAISSYLGNNSYKIIKSVDNGLVNHCDNVIDLGYICFNSFSALYLIETVNDGNLTCENCKKPDALDKMAGNVLKITDKLKKQEEDKTKAPAASLGKTKEPAPVLSKTEDIKKEPQKIYTIGSIGPGGGKVFFVDSSGQHGLEVTATDEPKRFNWNDAVAAANAHGPGWRLPSLDETKLLWANRVAVKGTLYGTQYWTSTEVGGTAYFMVFPYYPEIKDGKIDKLATFNVRPVRNF